MHINYTDGNIQSVAVINGKIEIELYNQSYFVGLSKDELEMLLDKLSLAIHEQKGDEL